MKENKLAHCQIGGMNVFVPLHGRRAWVSEATNIEIASPVVIPDGWSDAFRSGSDPFRVPLSIFVGPKGVGKSTLLHLKRAIVEGWVKGFSSANAVACLPSESETMSYRSTKDQVIRLPTGSKQAGMYGKLQPWVVLWQLLLGALLLQGEFERRSLAQKQGGQHDGAHRETPSPIPELPTEIKELFGISQPGQRLRADSIVRYLSAAVYAAHDERTLEQYYAAKLLPLIETSLAAYKYCMFVDAIDEHIQDDNALLINTIQQGWLQPKGVARDASADLPRDQSAYNVWANVQAGLIIAAQALYTNSNHRVRVYSTIRSEALHATESRIPRAQNISCAHVNYGLEKLETILRLNMAVDLENHGVERYFGADGSVSADRLETAERVFFGNDGKFRDHHGGRAWIDEIVRLSMERPRDLMLLMQGISREVRPSLPTTGVSEVRAALDGPSVQILDEFLTFIVGDEVKNEFNKHLFPFVHSSVLSKADLAQIVKNANQIGLAIEHPFCKLSSLGLLGHVREFDGNEPLQLFPFRTAGAFGLAEDALQLPDSVSYLVHPVLERAILLGSKRPSNVPQLPFQANSPLLIGNNLPWSGSVKSARRIRVELKKLPKLSVVFFNDRPVIGFSAGSSIAKGMPDRERRTARAHTRPSILAIAWLVALSTSPKAHISCDQVLATLRKLTSEQKLKPRISKGNGSIETYGWFQDQFLSISDSDPTVIDVRKYFNLLGFNQAITVIKNDNDSVFASGSVFQENINVIDTFED